MSSGPLAVFLDRDGTLNEEKDYLRSPDELQLIPGAARAVHRLNVRGFPTCVISNQSAVARGFLTEEGLSRIHDRLRRELEREAAHVDRIYYCPHHPTEGRVPYRVECECRKPKPGMLLRGERELLVDLSRSFVVGDSAVDMEAGNAVGASTVLVLTGYGHKAVDECRQREIAIRFVAPTIVEAVDFILDSIDGRLTAR